MSKMSTKYKLPFYTDDKGKEIVFKLPKWTMRKQEEVWSETSKYEKQYEKDEKGLDRRFRRILIKKGLDGVIPIQVTDEQLDSLHPDDFAALYIAIYLQGKDGILADDEVTFRSKNSKKKIIAK